MNNYLSKKLSTLSFLLMVLIVFIHGFNININFGDATKGGAAYWIHFLESFISDGVCRVAVPMFFAVSGYLASLNFADGFTIHKYLILIRKRVRSLLIPYLLVGFLGICFVIFLQQIPLSTSFFNNYRWETTSVGRWIFILLLSPVPYQLWFIRFLIFYFLLYPFIYLFARSLKLAYLFFLLYLWSNFYLQKDLGIIKIEAEGLFFFSIGVFLAIHKVDLQARINPFLFISMVFGWVVWIAYRTYLLLNRPIDHLAVHYHLIGFTLLGFVLLWFSYDYFHEYFAKNEFIQRNSVFAIGVFMLHEPLLTILKKLMIKSLNSSDLGLLAAYILAPILAFSLSLLMARWLFRYFPGFYGLLTGNRLPRGVDC